MQAPNWIALVFICLTFAGCPSSSASLQNGGQGDLSKPSYSVPSKGAFFEALLNYLYHIYPSSDTVSSTSWNDQLYSADEFTQGTPKRLYYAPRAGKRSAPAYEDVDEEKQMNEDTSKANDGARWKRSLQESHEEEETEEEKSRMKRDTSSSQPESNSNDDIDLGSSWWWSKAAVRRSPFSPRLGKRDEAHYGLVYDEDDDQEEDDFDSFEDGEDSNDVFEELASQGYADEEVASPQRLAVRSALVPRLGKKAVAFSPRLGKRVTAFIPRLGKRGDFAFSPRLGKRGNFAFSPRLGKKADFAFSPRLGKRGDFAFSPRLGKKADFAFSPRLGKRADFAFSPRLGKKSDFAFIPRLGKRGTAFIPRLGKRETGASTSGSEDSWRTNANDVSQQLQQRSVAFSPRLG